MIRPIQNAFSYLWSVVCLGRGFVLFRCLQIKFYLCLSIVLSNFLSLSLSRFPSLSLSFLLFFFLLFFLLFLFWTEVYPICFESTIDVK